MENFQSPNFRILGFRFLYNLTWAPPSGLDECASANFSKKKCVYKNMVLTPRSPNF